MSHLGRSLSLSPSIRLMCFNSSPCILSFVTLSRLVIFSPISAYLFAASFTASFLHLLSLLCTTSSLPFPPPPSALDCTGWGFFTWLHITALLLFLAYLLFAVIVNDSITSWDALMPLV
eukprot:m.129765 g.129765  ORF g.129765 m.129765 type:complete len:119 (+) comp15706_c0_seq7:470-826(+)